jgi:hypothetical protein
MDDLNPGHYQFKATKRGFADSPVAEGDLTAGEDLTLNLTLRANEHTRTLGRTSQAMDDKASRSQATKVLISDSSSRTQLLPSFSSTHAREPGIAGKGGCALPDSVKGI